MPSHGMAAFWRGPSSWLREQRLGRDYWIFFTAAFFFDAGFAVYFFLFNLFLLDQHWNERAMGLIGGALTAGSLLGTLPAGALTRRSGVRPLLIFLFAAAPLLGALRAIWVWRPAAICAAFLMGLAMSLWGVCMLPTVAAVTTKKNRAQAYSLIFSVSVGTSALGGLLCSALPRWLHQAGLALPPVEVKRGILLASCLVAIVGLIPVLQLPRDVAKTKKSTGVAEDERAKMSLLRWRMNPFLLRYLPAMALWSGFLAAFAPFANVYLARELHLPLGRIALMFSLVQVTQFCMGLLLPVVLQVFGLRNGIAITQGIAALTLAALAAGHAPRVAMVLYLMFSAAQWMSSPALYNLLMNCTVEGERGTAAAMTMFCGSVASTIATIAAGSAITRFGYAPTMLVIAAYALGATVLFWTVVTGKVASSAAKPGWESLEDTPEKMERIA